MLKIELVMANPNDGISQTELPHRPGWPDAKAPSTSPRLGLHNTKLSTIAMDEDCALHIQGQCQRFNRYNSFLDASQSAIPSAADVQATVAEIDRIMIEAERAIHENMSRLRRDIGQFKKDVSRMADPCWYRKVRDLTGQYDVSCWQRNRFAETHPDYDAPQFTDILNTMRIPDYNDFAEYLKETLPRASNMWMPEHEYGELTFMGKVHMLLKMVITNAAHRSAFSLLTTVKAKVYIVGHKRVTIRVLPKQVEYVDAQLLWLLDIHAQTAEQDEYWDFAESWRRLAIAWEDMYVEPAFLMRLLGTIRAKAETEVRYRTNIAINARLPQELADLVFEKAMAVEEIPLE